MGVYAEFVVAEDTFFVALHGESDCHPDRNLIQAVLVTKGVSHKNRLGVGIGDLGPEALNR